MPPRTNRHQRRDHKNLYIYIHICREVDLKVVHFSACVSGLMADTTNQTTKKKKNTDCCGVLPGCCAALKLMLKEKAIRQL